MVMKHLEADYEVDRPPSGFIPHFWDTIDSLGGTVGLSLIVIGILLFYFIVDYTITTNRKKREQKKKH
jgi:hypothetical protein